MNPIYVLKYTPALVNVICGLLNTQDGEICLGYSEDGEIIGLSNHESIIGKINDGIRQYLTPGASEHISIDSVVDDNKTGIKIRVSFVPEQVFCVQRSKCSMYYVYDFDQHKTLGFYSILALKSHLNNDLKVSELYKPYATQGTKFYRLGDIPKGQYLYKYMSLEAALLSLEKGSLRFVEPSRWDDMYESRFYTADYTNVPSGNENSPKLYACCMTSKRESEAAWKIYSRGSEGLASRCVRFKINKKKFLTFLAAEAQKYPIYIAEVAYQNKWIIDRIHENKLSLGKKNENFYRYFRYFTLDNYLNLLLLKREEYDYEKEIRIFVLDSESLNAEKFSKNAGDTNASEKYLQVDWCDLIECVYIDKKCSQYERELLKNALNPNVEIIDVDVNHPHNNNTTIVIDALDKNHLK